MKFYRQSVLYRLVRIVPMGHTVCQEKDHQVDHQVVHHQEWQMDKPAVAQLNHLDKKVICKKNYSVKKKGKSNTKITKCCHFYTFSWILWSSIEFQCITWTKHLMGVFFLGSSSGGGGGEGSGSTSPSKWENILSLRWITMRIQAPNSIQAPKLFNLFFIKQNIDNVIIHFNDICWQYKK